MDTGRSPLDHASLPEPERFGSDARGRFRSLVEALHDRVIVLDRDLRHVEVYGTSGQPEDNAAENRQAMIGKTAAELAGPELGRQHMEAGARALKGEHVSYEWSWAGPAGIRWYQTNLSPIRGAAGEVTGLVSVSHEVTGLVVAMMAAQESEQLLRSVVGSIDGVVTLCDGDLRIRAMFGTWLEAHGVTAAGYVGQSACRFFGIEDGQCRVLGGRVLAGETIEFDWEAVVEGGLRQMHATISAVRNPAGEAEGAVSVSWDVTELRRAEVERREAAERRRQGEKLESLGRLAGGVAHDFNNLLTVINGYADLLLQGGTLPPEASRMVAGMLQAGERAAGLTRQLLAFGRQQVMQVKVLDLNDIVREMGDMLRRVIGEDVRLEIRLGSDLGRVQADPTQMGQILMNLAVNSRDAMPGGGTLTVETANADLGDEYARWHEGFRAGSYVMLMVSDTGVGMDRETQRRVFEPFFTTKEQGKGTGLGLATVDGVVKQSGGTIVLYSEPGHGTTIKVYLPRVDAATGPVAAPAAPGQHLRGTETILLAEDEAHIRELAREVLESYGYRVLAFGDGALALALPPDQMARVAIVVTDVVMPNMSGPDLVRRLRADRPGLKAVYMSGYPDSRLGEGVELAPVESFIQKPFRPEELVRKVRALLDAGTT